MNKKKAIVLGGTNAHIDLIKKLQNRDYYVYLIDYYENPIARPYANEHIQASTLDKEKVLEIAKELKVDLVIATSVDQANLTACYVMEKMGLHVPYSYNVALEVTNKILMKRKMIDNGIPTAKLHFTSDNKNEYVPNEFPVIVKPANCNGSKGVKIARNKIEYNKYIKEASELSRTNEIIVEEFLEGKEVGCDCFISKGKAVILTLRERNKVNFNENALQQIKGTIYPADISEKCKLNIQNIMQKIANVFELDNTPLMAQMIINNDEVNIIEFAPRIGGGESGKYIKLITEFDIVEAAIESFIGNEVEVNNEIKEKYFSDVLIYGRTGIFERLVGLEEQLGKGNIEYFVQYRTKGSQISEEIVSANRIAAFVTSADSRKELKRKINEIIDSIDILDEDGVSMIRREVSKYYGEEKYE